MTHGRSLGECSKKFNNKEERGQKMNQAKEDSIEQVEREFLAQGLPVEAGFRTLLLRTYPSGVSRAQLNDLRDFFFAGVWLTFNQLSGLWQDKNIMLLNDSKIARQLIESELSRFYDEVLRKAHEQRDQGSDKTSEAI